MNVDLIQKDLNIKYYESIKTYLEKTNEIVPSWINTRINNINDDITSEKATVTESINDKNIKNEKVETDAMKQIYNTNDLYKKSWTKLNPIHKILKIKEFVNTLKINSEKERTELKEQLVNLIKMKILTKKEKVIYDETNGTIISLTNLQFKDGKYQYFNE